MEQKINQNKEMFKYTLIKFSSEFKFEVEPIINLIGLKLNCCVDFEDYKTFYNGHFENGIKLTFFKCLDKKELLTIHNILENNLRGYGCFFIDNEDFAGCCKEYLFNNGCFVGGYYKKYKGDISK